MELLSHLAHLLVPRHSNNHRARILHPSILSAVVAFFLIYQFAINFTLMLQPSILGYASSISPERVIELTNQERLKLGLPPLSLNGNLSQAAQLKAGDMFAFDYWSHNSPSGRTPWEFFSQVGYSYSFAGENLARDFQNSEAVVQAWMNSPTHRANIVNDDYQEIGLAVVDGTLDGVETTLVVQMFGTPTPTPPQVSRLASSVVGEVQAQTAPVGQSSSPPDATPASEPAGEEEPVVALPPSTFLQESVRRPIASPFDLTKSVTLVLLTTVVGVLMFDVIWVYRKKIVRLSGKNLAHLIFVGALLLSAILMEAGAIL